MPTPNTNFMFLQILFNRIWDLIHPSQSLNLHSRIFLFFLNISQQKNKKEKKFVKQIVKKWEKGLIVKSSWPTSSFQNGLVFSLTLFNYDSLNKLIKFMETNMTLRISDLR